MPSPAPPVARRAWQSNEPNRKSKDANQNTSAIRIETSPKNMTQPKHQSKQEHDKKAPRRSRDSDHRTHARQLALQFLHQLAVQKGANLDQLDAFLDEYCEQPDAIPLARDWTRETWHDLKRIDGAIAAAAHNWDVARINEVDRSNLRLAVHQLLDCHEISSKVVINEAIELAKQFSTAQAPGFINGVLDAVHREHAASQQQNTAPEQDLKTT